MSSSIQSTFLESCQSRFRRILHNSLTQYDPWIFTITIFLLISSIGVMIITRQPLLGLVLIAGIPVLLLFCIYHKLIVYALIIYSFIVKFIVGDVGLGAIANYVCDGLLLIALFFALVAKKHSLTIPVSHIPGYCFLAFWSVATLSAIAHGVPFGLYIWACRNTFRLFGILYCCVKLLDKSDIYRLIKFIFGFFVVNSAVCTYQHFVLGIGPDNTNGLFGTESGGNAMMNVLLFVVCAFSIFEFFNNKYSAWIFILVLVCSSYLAAIAELKFFYFELMALIIFAICSQKFSLKTIISVISIVIAVLIGIRVLITFNPSIADFFNWQKFSIIQAQVGIQMLIISIA